MLETECIDIINKFPMILKQVLEEEPSLREEIKQYYHNRTYDDKQTVYRIITREVGNNNIIITKEDFYTNIKKNNDPRQRCSENELEKYGCSVYSDIEKLKKQWSLKPISLNPSFTKVKHIISGKIHSKYGIYDLANSCSHINWWLFSIDECEKEFCDRFVIEERNLRRIKNETKKQQKQANIILNRKQKNI